MPHPARGCNVRVRAGWWGEMSRQGTRSMPYLSGETFRVSLGQHNADTYHDLAGNIPDVSVPAGLRVPLLPHTTEVPPLQEAAAPIVRLRGRWGQGPALCSASVPFGSPLNDPIPHPMSHRNPLLQSCSPVTGAISPGSTSNDVTQGPAEGGGHSRAGRGAGNSALEQGVPRTSPSQRC